MDVNGERWPRIDEGRRAQLRVMVSASPDLLREMIRGFAQKLMYAEVEQLCGGGYGEVSPDRVATPYSG